MTFDELLTEVYDITGREDLTSLSKNMIKAATLKAHTSDFYSRDIYETGVQFGESSLTQSFDPYNLITNFRAPKYIKRVNDETDEVGKVFDVITPEEVIDSYGALKSDVYYIAGRTVEIRSAVAFSKILLGAYVLPIVREEAYSSWIAELVPYFIIFEAASKIFKAVGQDQEAAYLKAELAEQFDLLRTVGLTDQGY